MPKLVKEQFVHFFSCSSLKPPVAQPKQVQIKAALAVARREMFVVRTAVTVTATSINSLAKNVA